MAQEQVETESGNRPPLLAFRLGWTTAELLGRLRRGYRPRKLPAHDDDYAPRLSVSHGQPTSVGEQFWLAARRLVDLGEALDLWSQPASPAPPHLVHLLPARLEDWVEGDKSVALTPAELREMLNDWSLDAWSRLHVQDDALARTFTAGMSLADTYWSLRRPPATGTEDTRLKRELWNEPLRFRRLAEERRRLKEIAGDLPTGISDVLRHHLRHWSIGTELVRDGGRLSRVHWLHRPSHRLGLLHRRTPATKVPSLDRDEERAIQDALERQAEIWRDLIFGLRTPESYLYLRERAWLAWLARALFLLLLLVPLGIIAVTLVSLASVWLGGVAVPGLLSAVENTVDQAPVTAWNDLLKLLSTLLTTIGAFVVGIRPVARWFQQAYHRIHHEVTVFMVTQRTLNRWDRRLDGRKR
jgi:hypothetical protein